MKDYILINPLLMEVLTPDEETEYEKLQNQVADGELDAAALNVAIARMKELDKKRDEPEPEPEQEPKQGPKQPADAGGAEGSGEKVETADEFIARKSQEFSNQYVGDLQIQKPGGGQLSDEERERLLSKAEDYTLKGEIDYYLRKSFGMEEGESYVGFLAGKVSEVIAGVDIGDLIDIVMYGKWEDLFELLEPNIAPLFVSFAENVGTATVGDEQEQLTEEMRDWIVRGVYGSIMTVIMGKAYLIASDRVYDNLAASAKKLNLNRDQLLEIAKRKKGIPADEVLSAADEEKVIEAARKKGFRPEAGSQIDVGKWGADTSGFWNKAWRGSKSFGVEWSKNTFRRLAFGPLITASELLFERIMISSINNLALEQIIGEGSKGMSVDEKLDQLDKNKEDLLASLKQQEANLAKKTASGKGKEAGNIKNEIEATKRRIGQVDKALVQIDTNLRRGIEAAGRSAKALFKDIIPGVAVSLYDSAREKISLSVLDNFADDIIFDGTDFVVGGNLKASYFRPDYLKRVAQAEADMAKRAESSRSTFNAALKKLRNSAQSSINRLKKVLKAVKGTLNEQQENEINDIAKFFEDILKEAEKIESETLEIQADISGVLDEMSNATKTLSDRLGEAASDLLKSDLAQLQRGVGDSLGTDTQFQTPVDESKIRITKSKLIDLISEQVKEQTQTVDVTKDQLVALVAQEAFKQINRKK